LNGILYFEGNRPECGHELWRSDGTELGTYLIKDIENGTGGDISYLVASDNYLYFNGYNSTLGRELWISDGTDVGTTVVADSNPGSASGNPRYITAVEDTVYYCAYSYGGDIWFSNGTESGTLYIAPLKFPDFIRRWGPTVFVLTNEFACGNELYIC
jgi:ELWxxDGT repeat protein